MPQFLTALFSWLFGKNPNEQRLKLASLKSLIYMILIPLLICNYFDNHSTVILIKKLIGDKVIYCLSLFLSIILNIFTIIAIISIILAIVSIIVSKILFDILDESQNIIWHDYFFKMFKGSLYRLILCIENITIALLTAYLFNYEVFKTYREIYHHFIWSILVVSFSIVFIKLSLQRILNRFFVLWEYENNKHES